MVAMPEPNESLREKALKALEANHDSHPVPSRPAPVPAPAAAGAGTYAEEVELRLRALRTVRDLEPKRSCQADVVGNLTQSLKDTPGDSIHYRTMLEKLHEAHEEWLRLEEKLWAANYIIRSTQWLVDLLDDPGPQSAAPGPTLIR